jgi:RimJ/RimL family protein N-acetyltransferase
MGSSLDGTVTRLVDVTPADVPLLGHLRSTQAGGFNDFDHERAPIPPEAWVDGRLRNEERGTFFVKRLLDGAIVGTISYHRVSYGPNPGSRAWMIGIDLAPEGRGQGLGSEAQRLLANWLFETTDANRVEASTDVENVAEARALEKAGFTREGIVRGAQFRTSAYHDLLLFGRLRSDPGRGSRPG